MPSTVESPKHSRITLTPFVVALTERVRIEAERSTSGRDP